MSQQLWRRHPDSSHLAGPRTFIRVFVAPAELEPTAAWYEQLLGVERDMVMPYPEKDLALIAVGGFLIIAGTEASLSPFRQTAGTLLVADIGPYEQLFQRQGLEFVQPRFRAPVGEGFTVRHPDGTVIEYVHHRPAAHELS